MGPGNAGRDAARPSSQEVVLVVDDDVSARGPVTRALRYAGYYVLEATNGEEALQVMQEYHAPVHLVISDVVMPEMNGAELVAFLRATYPSLRMLFISGYTAGFLEAAGETVVGVDLLSKPFSPPELLAKVRDILDSEWDPGTAAS